MSRLAQAIRSHRESNRNNRNRRDFGRAVQSAPPAMRDELLVIAQRQELIR